MCDIYSNLKCNLENFFSFLFTEVYDITTILMEAKDLLSSQGDGVARKPQKWAERTTVLNVSWAQWRVCLWETILKANFAVKEDTLCMKCLEEPAVIRCNECFTAKYLCGSCDQKVHELLPCHDRDAVVNGHYEPISPTLSRNCSGEWVTIGEYKFPVKGPAVFEVWLCWHWFHTFVDHYWCNQMLFIVLHTARQLPHSEISCPVCNTTCKRLWNQEGQHCILVSATCKLCCQNA